MVDNVACATDTCEPEPGSGVGAGSVWEPLDASLTVMNSILDNGGDCGSSLVITSNGYNIDSDGSCGLTDPTDLPNTDPLL